MAETLATPEVPKPDVLPQEIGLAALRLEADSRINRANEIAETIDPAHVLPAVEIIADPSVKTSRGTFVPQESLIMHEGQQIGECVIVSDKKGKVRWFSGVSVNETGKGFGSSAYKSAIEQAMLDGYSFQTHEYSQSAGAKKVWERLADAGVARVVEEFKSDGDGKFLGHYIIDAIK